MVYPFGAFLVAWLERAGVSQAELRRRMEADGCVVTDSAVSHWAAGTFRPRSEHLAALCDALGASDTDRLSAMATHAKPRAEAA